MLNLLSWLLPAILSPDRHILLHVDSVDGRHNDTIDIHYSHSGGTNNFINFSFVTRISIPVPDISPLYRQVPVALAFSSDGSKFAMTMACSRVSVWDIRSKVPLKTFREAPNSGFVRHLQFSSGKLGKEVLIFVEVRLPMFTL